MLIVGGGIPPSPPRIFNGGGDAHRVKGDAHPPLPYEHPSPPYVPVTPYEQLKFPRVINPDSPLNDSLGNWIGSGQMITVLHRGGLTK